MELPSPSLSFTGAGITQTITPNTRNGQDSSYTFTLFNADVANLSLSGGSSPKPIRRRRFLPNGDLERDFVGNEHQYS